MLTEGASAPTGLEPFHIETAWGVPSDIPQYSQHIVPTAPHQLPSPTAYSSSATSCNPQQTSLSFKICCGIAVATVLWQISHHVPCELVCEPRQPKACHIDKGRLSKRSLKAHVFIIIEQKQHRKLARQVRQTFHKTWLYNGH